MFGLLPCLIDMKTDAEYGVYKNRGVLEDATFWGILFRRILYCSFFKTMIYSRKNERTEL